MLLDSGVWLCFRQGPMSAPEHSKAPLWVLRLVRGMGCPWPPAFA